MIMSRFGVDRGGLSSKMTWYEKGCEGLGLRGSRVGPKQLARKGLQLGVIRPVGLCQGCSGRGFGFRNTWSYCGGREGARMISSIRTWFRVC